MPLDQIAARVRAAFDCKGEPEIAATEAILGAVQKPAICLDAHWNLSRDRKLVKSRDKLRHPKHPPIKAVRNFMAVNGGIDIGQSARRLLGRKGARVKFPGEECGPVSLLPALQMMIRLRVSP